jgi:hypothetical protein
MPRAHGPPVARGVPAALSSSLQETLLPDWTMHSSWLRVEGGSSHRKLRRTATPDITFSYRAVESIFGTVFDKAERTYERAVSLGLVDDEQPAPLPAWLTDEPLLDRITSSHRTALLCKDYGWYHQFAWAEDSGEPSTYDYVWATT